MFQTFTISLFGNRHITNGLAAEAHLEQVLSGIISEHACMAGFDRNGCLIRPFEKKEAPEYNLFRNTLSDVLKRAFPRKAAAH